MLKRLGICIVAALALASLGACGKGDIKPGSSGDPTTSTTAATTSSSAP